MRRKDKEITDIKILNSVLQRALICRIAMSQKNIPYIVPVNFGYSDRTIYIHSAAEGRKIDIIKNNNNICFEAESDTEIVKSERPCNWGMKYLCVIGNGKAYFITDPEEKTKALNIIIKKYSDNKDQYTFTRAQIDELTIIKITITEMTGKRSGI